MGYLLEDFVMMYFKDLDDLSRVVFDYRNFPHASYNHKNMLIEKIDERRHSNYHETVPSLIKRLEFETTQYMRETGLRSLPNFYTKGKGRRELRRRLQEVIQARDKEFNRRHGEIDSILS